ncbi:hypothetical protein [Streptomyces acidiscabies]|uniref:hypothetical protein n=1 Tax=Streptomyces acidiscabies TaxID=42234 RepID=UPI0009523889|nr:hypothetical protein [Streptomyces acidiscabies]
MKPLSEMTEREYFASVGRRPGMFVGKTSFHMLTAFLTGYDQHAIKVLFELLDEFAAECEAAQGTRFPERHSPERGESR